MKAKGITVFLIFGLAVADVVLSGLPSCALADEPADTRGASDSIKTLDHNPMAGATVGQRYQAKVPDTLDLADRMDLAVGALSAP